jgi:hypothetical protein
VKRIDVAKVKAVLATRTDHWPALRQALESLNDDELALADQTERTTRRRINMLRGLKAEQQVRQGKKQQMLHLRMEVTH